jgi:hypothetical protein
MSLREVAVEQYRQKVLIPYCEKYGVRFMSGMGGWVAENQLGEKYGEYFERNFPRYVLDVLECSLLSGQYAGSMMDDYTPTGWNKK